MSVCSCYCGEGVLGSRISGPHIARKAGFLCPNCEQEVPVGKPCIDHAGLYSDGEGGFFGRFHVLCFWLMEQFQRKLCGAEYVWWPFDIHEASGHAMAHGDEPFWQAWLLLYGMRLEEMEAP